MKKNLLFAAMFAVGLVSNAQTANFNQSFPDDWIVNRDLKLAKYDNPLTGAMDTGMVTAPINIAPTPVLHLITTAPAEYTGTATTINVNFDAFPFKGDTRDFRRQDADRDFRCNSTIKAYLVAENYNHTTTVPNPNDVYGESNFEDFEYGANSLSIRITKPLVAGESYRIFIAGRVSGRCNVSQSYVVDNIVIGESLYTEDFVGSTVPTGWNLLNGLQLVDYNSPAPGCEDNRGLATPAITLNAGSNILTAPIGILSTSTTLRLNFDLFAFNSNANFACANQQNNLSCSTTLQLFIVDATNASTGAVPTGTIYGQSEVQLLNLDANSIAIDLNTANPMTPGVPYKLYVVSSSADCSGNSQRYVLDNVALLNEIDEEDFDDVFPAGWDFNRDLKITQYCNRNSDNNTDVGIATPPVERNVTNNYLMATPATRYDPGTGSLTVSFDLFAFEGNTRGFECIDKENSLNCATSVKIYIVSSTYNSTNVPPASAIVGESEWVDLSIDNLNNISVPVTGTFDANQRYRLIAFGRTQNCGNNDQAYVIDNINVVEISRGALPVSFSLFTAQRNKSNVALNWETAMEENNRGFYVQRNVDGTWKNVAFVFSKAERGNSSAKLSYTYNDVNNSRGISQYRLLQVDHDSKGRLSEIRSVRGEEQAAKIMVYPNPSNTGNVTVMFEDGNSKRDVFVSDASGRVVKQYRNINGNTLNIENLADGFYTIQIANQTTSANTVEKVIVKKR